MIVNQSKERPLEIQQDLTILTVKSSKAYAIPCEEWHLLKRRIQDLTDSPFLFSTIGGILLGAALSTLISILLGTFNNQQKPTELIIAWAIFIVCTICGLLSYGFSYMQQKMRHVQASEVVAQMELIEQRYKASE